MLIIEKMQWNTPKTIIAGVMEDGILLKPSEIFIKKIKIRTAVKTSDFYSKGILNSQGRLKEISDGLFYSS